MRMCLFLLILVTNLLSCKTKAESPGTVTSIATIDSKEDLVKDSITDAQKWLVENIETYFRDFDKLNGDYSSICTPKYREFKEDATGIDMDGGMTEKEFITKWGKDAVKYAGIGEGFMIGGNDFGKIKVTKCNYKERSKEGGYLFETIIEDTDFKSTFERKIIVVPSGNTYLIDQVFELKNTFKEEQ